MWEVRIGFRIICQTAKQELLSPHLSEVQQLKQLAPNTPGLAFPSLAVTAQQSTTILTQLSHPAPHFLGELPQKCQRLVSTVTGTSPGPSSQSRLGESLTAGEGYRTTEEERHAESIFATKPPG